ncbi:MAG: DMT family transporter [Candidatus Brocadiia bacterium]
MDRRALLLGAFACLTWSTVFVLGRLVIDRHEADPVVLGLYRFGIGGAVLLGVLLARGRGEALGAFLAEPLRFLLLGATGGFGMGFFVFLALSHTHSIVVQLIMNSNPVLIVPLSLVIGERVGVGKVVGVVLGVGGCALVLGGVSPRVVAENPHHALGGALAALSGLCWAVYTVAGRGAVRRYGGLPTTAISTLLGGAFFLVAALARGQGLVLARPGALAGLYMGLVPTALGFTAWYVALEKLPANVLGPLQFIVPVGGVALAVALLGEALTATVVVGGVLALSGVYLSTRR